MSLQTHYTFSRDVFTFFARSWETRTALVVFSSSPSFVRVHSFNIMKLYNFVLSRDTRSFAFWFIALLFCARSSFGFKSLSTSLHSHSLSVQKIVFSATVWWMFVITVYRCYYYYYWCRWCRSRYLRIISIARLWETYSELANCELQNESNITSTILVNSFLWSWSHVRSSFSNRKFAVFWSHSLISFFIFVVRK